MAVEIGGAIRRVRIRLRKGQREFAEMLGSQSNSISRYEGNRVQPSLPVLWKLYHLAEPDEKPLFEDAIRMRIGTDLAGSEASIDMPMAQLRDLVTFQERLESLGAWNPNRRKDFNEFLAAVLDLLMGANNIDRSIPELLRLWRDSKQDNEAAERFRQAAAFLKVSLTTPGAPPEAASARNSQASRS
jgi:transcriptional regulator with XRE-family HTH domain